MQRRIVSVSHPSDIIHININTTIILSKNTIPRRRNVIFMKLLARSVTTDNSKAAMVVENATMPNITLI